MNIIDERPIHGLVSGIYYGQNARVDELNERISARVQSDTPLMPNFDVRPVPTKYARFPMIDRITQHKVDIRPMPEYSVANSFASIQSRGPVDGYFSHVQDESILRNQIYAIQKADQVVYVPQSESDLYKVTMATPSSEQHQPYPDLFSRYQMNVLAPVRNSDPRIGSEKFFNNTRLQLRGGVLNPSM
jgi:hypothetical protein